ncbi:MAG: hypothetical protein NTW87_02830 [Planctomycetota bacterium]|nr:hypothetical protein [Planctomycetota bacterium]
MSRSVLCIVTLCLTVVIGPAAAADKGDRETATALLSGVDALLAKGDEASLASAAEICKRALAADATCPAAYLKLGQCQEQANKPREAFKSYKNAADLAKKENDSLVARKATFASEKLGTGLLQIGEADQKLITKLLPLADDALADDALETARQIYSKILALAPAHEKAMEGLGKTEKAIAARGDPVKAKIAAAMLAEIYYLVATGDKAKAAKVAADMGERYGDTGPGKEAAAMLANSFEPPKNLSAEIAEAKKVLKEQAKKATVKKPSAAVGTTPVVTPVAVSAPPVDVDALEKTAMEDAKKTPKDQLLAAFKDAFAKGKDSFSKATPGTEGNQQSLRAALEQFIRCESLYMRIEEEKLNDTAIAAMQKQASTSRYSCMKMTILAH